VIGVGGETVQATLSSTLPQLNWGYRGIFDRLDLMAEELRKDRSLPKYAQAITLYHLIVEGSLAQPGQHFIEDFFASGETLPGFSSGIANVSRDEQRHIGFGVKVLSELLARDGPGAEENRAAVVELLRETLPYGPAVFSPPGLDRSYTECYGFSLEEIFAFGLKLIRQRWRTIGFPTEEMPPGVFPFDPAMTEDEVAGRQVKLMMAGILGPPDGPRPQSSPELQRLYFDVVGRSADPSAADGSPLVYPVALQRRRPLAPDHRQRLDPGRARRGAEPDRDDRDQLGRLGRLGQAGRQPAEDAAPAPDPPPRTDPRVGADAAGLQLATPRASAGFRLDRGSETANQRDANRLVAALPSRPWTSPSYIPPAGLNSNGAGSASLLRRDRRGAKLHSRSGAALGGAARPLDPDSSTRGGARNPAVRVSCARRTRSADRPRSSRFSDSGQSRTRASRSTRDRVLSCLTVRAVGLGSWRAAHPSHHPM